MAKEKEQDVDAMLDRLLEGKRAEEVVGQGGLLEDLTKRLLERALEGELTEHLGYEKHATEGATAATRATAARGSA
jgi:putative transposase